MKVFMRSMVALSAATLLAGVASAATITQTVTWPLQATDLNGQASTPSSILYFDSSLGTLDSVVISTTYGFQSAITITNTAASSSNGNVRTQSGSQFASSDSSITSVLNSYVNNYIDPVDGDTVSFGAQNLSPIAYDIRGSRGSYSLSSGQSTSYSSSGSSTTGPATITTMADLMAFEATGSFNPYLNTLTGLVTSNNGGNTSFNQSTQAQGSMTVVYNYTVPAAAVPEPASWAMMVGGFGMLGGALRRKRTTAVTFG